VRARERALGESAGRERWERALGESVCRCAAADLWPEEAPKAIPPHYSHSIIRGAYLSPEENKRRPPTPIA
jgi:hypothetical protein